MTTMLVLNMPPGLKEDFIDYLLSLECVQGFTSFKAMGHGEHEHLTLAEQVSGQRQRVQFEVLLDEDDVPQVIQGLGSEVGRDITYWQQPVSGIGRT